MEEEQLIDTRRMLHNILNWGVEVACSQRQKDLPSTADEYICGSSGNIKVVLGLDIE